MSLDSLITVFTNIFHFLVVLGLAVIFHEWGHFIVAKLAGAKVDRFSVGFGKKLFGYTWHETEYVLCVLPLGGYVKIRGMDPDEETTGADYEFLELSAWKRIAIVLAGPLMNFVLAFLIYVFIFGVYGEPYVASTTIGKVPYGTWAWEMGLQEDDRILKINGTDVTTWDEISQSQSWSTIYNPETGTFLRDKITILVERDNQKLVKEYTVSPKYKALFEIGEEVNFPDALEGIFVTKVMEDGAAAKAGLPAGIQITAVDGKSFSSRNDWSNYISTRYEKVDDGSYNPVPLTIAYQEPSGATNTLTITPDITYPDPDAIPFQPRTKLDITFDGEITVQEFFTPTLSPLGIAPKLKPSVGAVFNNSPAKTAGLAIGSQIVEIDGQPVDDWNEVLLSVQDSIFQDENGTYKAKPMQITWLTPENQMEQQSITPEVTMQNLPTYTSIKTGKQYPIAQIGVDRMKDRKKLGVIGSISAGWTRLSNMCEMMVDFIYRLFTGGVSRKLLGGPIAIYQLSGETGRRGLESFLNFIALLSANLGILNLFPFPPLDGGHIVFYSYEIIRRKRLTMKQMENFGKIGFVLIIPLMIWIIFNDLDRLNVFSWFTDLFR
jgi:regulator of sigma E protease